MPQLFIDLSANTGALKHGASGFLYGLGNAGIPSVNVLAPLKPQVAAQKPEGGLQHPNGGAFNVAETYKEAGGREIEIYLQDCYAEWPYENLGIDDYAAKVEDMVRQVVANPNRELFSYVPLNEPDQIWYNKSDKKEKLFQDWKTLCEKIRAVDSAARIVGPNFANYDGEVYREFLQFARDNHCLPDVVSWHELNDSFFANWYARYDDERSHERALGISPREICINEYARISGDLGVPGKLVQWLARFENSKVDACLAYWTTAGCLNDLVARDSDNQATGGWWLYKWYGSMTGNTVQVTPPDANAEGLQGLACFDADKNQARILFGGCSGSAHILVNGLRSDLFGAHARVVIWVIGASGTAPSNGPVCVMQTTVPIANGQIAVTLNDMLETDAYQMIVTTSVDDSFARTHFADPDFYSAEYADQSGDAISFVVTARDNGFYNVRIHTNARQAQSNLRLALNGAPLTEISIEPNVTETNVMKVFLTRGINRLTFEGMNEFLANMQAIQLAAISGAMQAYDAAANEITMRGDVIVVHDSAAPGGSYVGGIGNGASNVLQFNNIRVGASGIYRMVVHYANAEFRGAHDYNTNVVDRYADIRVNGRDAQRVYFRNTFAWNVYRTQVIDVALDAGVNTIEFSNTFVSAPHIAKIEIAARLG